jgi:hypothetical protein
MQASRGRGVYNSYSLLTSTLDWVNGQRHDPGALCHWEKKPRYTLDRRLGGSQSWSGQRLRDKSFASVGHRTPVVQPAVRHYTD